MVECEYFIKNKNSYILFWVLIDTWWNVNQQSVQSDKHHNGFNRYMVECESRYYTFDIDNPLGFNRYMVECELLHAGRGLPHSDSF